MSDDLERRRAVYRLLEQAVEEPPERREEILAAAPEELAAEVRELLVAGDRTTTFLDRPHPLVREVPEAPRPLPESLGPFRVLGLLGSGGMGQVFLAEQLEPVRRRVALKVLHAAAHGAEAEARFRTERDAMARLDHPNVAKILEAGTTADGRAYFAMERIEGAPITEYCDREALSLEERVRLFVAVCRGTEHAHQKLLLHRDLKPSNVLVTEVDGRPTPRIIDFGIAKYLDDTLQSTGLTGDRMIGTPAYMSPETLGLGGGVDTRSDVFSLGVLLYELITGVSPWDDGGRRGPVEILRYRSEAEPRRPRSRLTTVDLERRQEIARRRRVTVSGLEHGLRGDLEWIVMKAVAREPERRYGSAAELGADLERFLNAEPVSARPPSPLYLLRKAVVRHRGLVTAAALLAAALVAGVVGTSIGLIRARQAEERARGEAEASRQALGFVVDLFEAASPEQARGDEVTVRELVDRGVERIGAEELPPLSRARLLHTLADVHVRLGLYGPAGELAAEALAIREAGLPADHPEVVAAVDLLGNLERRAGRLDRAAPLLERVVAIEQARTVPDPIALADALNSLGNLRWSQGRTEDAESLHRRALELRREALGPEAVDVAASHNNLGALYWSLGRLDEAEDHLRSAADLLERGLEPDHPRIADALGNLGILTTSRGRYAEAEALHRRALAIREKVLGPDHPDTATTLANLAIALSKSGQEEEAERLYLRALDVRRRALGEEHPETLQVVVNLGLLYGRAGRLEEAVRLHRRALDVRERTLGPGDPATARGRVNLAIALRDLGRLAEARGLLERALADQRSSPDAGRSLATTQHHLGVLAAREGRYAEAEERLRESIVVRESGGEPEPVLLAATLHELGELCRRDGRSAEAADSYLRALELRRGALPAGHADLRRTEAALAELGAVQEPRPSPARISGRNR